MRYTCSGDSPGENILERNYHEKRRKDQEQEPGEPQPEYQGTGKNRPDCIAKIPPDNEKRGDTPPVFLDAETVHQAQGRGVKTCMAQCCDDGKEHYQVIALCNSHEGDEYLSLIHISEPTRQAEISYAVL